MNGLMEFKSGREIGERVAGEWEKMVLRLWLICFGEGQRQLLWKVEVSSE
jgi:hypothetical protein